MGHGRDPLLRLIAAPPLTLIYWFEGLVLSWICRHRRQRARTSSTGKTTPGFFFGTLAGSLKRSTPYASLSAQRPCLASWQDVTRSFRLLLSVHLHGYRVRLTPKTTHPGSMNPGNNQTVKLEGCSMRRDKNNHARRGIFVDFVPVCAPPLPRRSPRKQSSTCICEPFLRSRAQDLNPSNIRSPRLCCPSSRFLVSLSHTLTLSLSLSLCLCSASAVPEGEWTSP